MGSIQNSVYYCCVARDNRILYAYGGGDHEMDGLALLCLKSTPPFHKWYFETTGKRTFGFLIEDGYVFFIVANENVRNPEILQFLEHLRDEFKKVAIKGSRGSLSEMNSFSIQEHLVLAIRRLIGSLENVADKGSSWTGNPPSHDTHHAALSLSPTNSANGQVKVASSTMVPLLGKSSKPEKKAKDHVIAMRDIGQGEHRKSTDRGATSDSISATLGSSDQSRADSSVHLQKELVPTSIRSATQSIRKKWWRQVRIVLTIDAAVCLVLFVIWLCICRGIECVR